MRKFELLVKNGTVIDPASAIERRADVGFSDGRVVAVESDLPANEAAHTVDASGCLVAPGLIDLHAHVYQHGTALGVDPDHLARSSGTTTIVDAGSAGAANFAGLCHHVISRCQARILAFINIAYPGIFGFGRGIMVGECLDPRLLNVEECVRVARQYADHVVGVKVRIGIGTSGALGVQPLDVALEAAQELGLPVMTHIGAPPPAVAEVLDRLRPGDILTHCFRPFPNALIDAARLPRKSFLDAKARGVIFDIGHGSGSFGFDICRTMLEQGIPPDVVSSDVHVLSAKGPAFDLLVTMSKFLNLGMAPAQIIKAVSQTPAKALRREAIGHLGIGAVADCVVLGIEEGAFEFEDCTGQKLRGNRRFSLRHVVVNGRPLTSPRHGAHQGKGTPS